MLFPLTQILERAVQIPRLPDLLPSGPLGLRTVQEQKTDRNCRKLPAQSSLFLLLSDVGPTHRSAQLQLSDDGPPRR